MVHQKVTEPSNVNSHIQMPKLLLRRFHNDKTRFCYYDVKGRFIGTKGTAESTNTEFGYWREGLGLPGFSGGQVGDDAGVEIHRHLIPGSNLLCRLFAFQDGQADVDGVAVEDPGEALGDDTAGAAGLDDQRRMLPG